ncbi:unnamed protein product [Arabidopsis thaliana]|uniref:(thale cress) hypothetical protein n=1 Tax=Arabidopsis thaliana TaxID=3702 RepID=A0A7G2E1I0_ARATH|nr:unnamed protein product [Arabidopsis thaliana]
MSLKWNLALNFTMHHRMFVRILTRLLVLMTCLVSVSYIKAKDESTSVTDNQVARQLWGKRSHAKDKLKLKKRRKGLKSWMFKYKQENERLWRLHNHVLSFPNLCDRRIDRLGTTRKVKFFGGMDIIYVKNFVSLVIVGEVHEAPGFDRTFRHKEKRGTKKNTKRVKSWMFKFRKRNGDAGHGEQYVYDRILMVKEQLLQTSLVIHEIMRNRKIKSFKYKSVEVGIKRQHIQLGYKCRLVFEEWLRSWGSRESWRNHNLEASNRKSSFAFDAFQSGFGVDVINFKGVQQLGCRDVMLQLTNKGRFRLLQSCLGLLKDSSNDEAESSPVLNFAAKHTLLWLQNYSEKMHIVSERGRNKKRICSKTWMFKYKAPLKRIHDKLGKSKDCDALLMVLMHYFMNGVVSLCTLVLFSKNGSMG